MYKKADFFDSTVTSARDFVKLFTQLNVLKALAAGGALGYVAERLTGPRITDVQNAQLQLKDAQTNDVANKLQVRLATQYRRKKQNKDAQKRSMML